MQRQHIPGMTAAGPLGLIIAAGIYMERNTSVQAAEEKG